MAWLLRTPKPRCSEADCGRYGIHIVRSVMMHRRVYRDDAEADLSPRCLTHARALVDWYEQRERNAGLDRDGLPLTR